MQNFRAHSRPAKSEFARILCDSIYYKVWKALLRFFVALISWFYNTRSLPCSKGFHCPTDNLNSTQCFRLIIISPSLLSSHSLLHVLWSLDTCSLIAPTLKQCLLGGAWLALPPVLAWMYSSKAIQLSARPAHRASLVFLLWFASCPRYLELLPWDFFFLSFFLTL